MKEDFSKVTKSTDRPKVRPEIRQTFVRRSTFDTFETKRIDLKTNIFSFFLPADWDRMSHDVIINVSLCFVLVFNGAESKKNEENKNSRKIYN